MEGNTIAVAGLSVALPVGVSSVAALRESSMLQETLWIVTTDNGGPTTECSTTGQSNWPFRGSKCSIWVREQRRALPTLSLSLLSRPLLQRQEGGTRGTGFLYWEGMPAASQGIRYTGLIHAADWLPSVVAGLGLRPLGPAETLPLDGVDCWAALLANATSPRTDIYCERPTR